MNPFLLIKDSFYSKSKALRQIFDNKFENAHSLDSSRFVWDYWYIKNQYRLHRTPADHFFGKKLFDPFVKDLINWGRLNLGCQSISQPWLSYYTDGCFQNFHTDAPHGPWAFVFSLTANQSKFSGGSTQILKPETLSFWKNFRQDQSKEMPSIVSETPPKFNRLITFDPRFPHGVSRVTGPLDPRESRVVIHGWFTDPRPFITGPLSTKNAVPVLDKIAERVFSILPSQELNGILTFRIDLKPSGEVSRHTILSNTLMSQDGTHVSYNDINRVLKDALRQIKFCKSRAASSVTVPLQFSGT